MTTSGQHHYTIDEKNNHAQLSLTLASYKLLFGLMGKLLYSYPDRSWMESLATNGVFDEIPCVETNSEILKGRELLSEWNTENREGLSQAAFSEIEVDYVRLFIGGNKSLLAPPWESIFVSPEPTFFQRSTLHVRYWYKRFGLQAENLNHEPDDHIGLVLAFLSHLFTIALNNFELSKEVEYQQTIAEIRKFSTQHVFRWAPRCCDLVIENAKTKFFCGVGLLTKGSLRTLANFLEVDIKLKVFR